MKLFKFGNEYFAQDIKGKTALVRIPGINGEPKNLDTFMKNYESCSKCIKLYEPNEAFSNWDEFSELESVKLMVCDKGKDSDTKEKIKDFLRSLRS
ncbi:MAG TPA: hypothetical protein V6D28_21640 [Leptolyngbyaceae cyanobacterium]